MNLAMENFELYLRFGDKASIKMIKNAGFDAIDYSFYNECSGDEVLGEGYIAHPRQ